MTSKILDCTATTAILLTVVSAFGVMRGFEQGYIDFTGFYIGLCSCITLVIIITILQHNLSKKRKSPRGAGTPSKALRNKSK